MEIIISPKTARKLKYEHKVTEAEIHECFENRSGETVIDDREQHRSIPPTEWFIAATDAGRKLKIVFIPLIEDKVVALRTAYPPNKLEERLYEKETGRF